MVKFGLRRYFLISKYTFKSDILTLPVKREFNLAIFVLLCHFAFTFSPVSDA